MPKIIRYGPDSRIDYTTYFRSLRDYFDRVEIDAADQKIYIYKNNNNNGQPYTFEVSLYPIANEACIRMVDDGNGYVSEREWISYYKNPSAIGEFVGYIRGYVPN